MRITIGKINLITKPKVIEGKEIFLLGANFGPYKDIEYYKRHKELFRSYLEVIQIFALEIPILLISLMIFLM